MNHKSKILIAAVFIAIATSNSTTRAQKVDFNRDVRPILSDKCYFCHGPDDNNRHAELRLDVRENAIGTIEAGELTNRILSPDAELVMPPPTTNLLLSKSEKNVLQRWIEQGANYADHWAFTPLPETIAVPEMVSDDFSRNEIDRFVIKQLKEETIKPSKPADPLRWFRRVTLDLTGLPPMLKDIDEFEKQVVSEDIETVYSRTVDRLLDTPAFGEHIAVAWLDSARYADSYGYQSDRLNTQWPYRDWVVRAFNENLPYDQFLTWQLAGDLLPSPSQDQLLATAFNRLHRLNNEGGAVFEEWRTENVADRVHTFGTAMLGLTMECCRCHDHKYDPISTRDYYSLSAFFNSIDESGVYDFPEKVPCPSLLLPTPEQTIALQAASQRMFEVEQEYAKAIELAKTTFKADHQITPHEIPYLRLALSFDQPFDDALKNLYHPCQADRTIASVLDLVTVEACDIAELPADLAADESVAAARMAIRLDGDRGLTADGIEPIDRWMAVSVVMTICDVQRASNRSILAHHSHGTDCGYNGWEFAITDGFLDVRLARVWPGNAISVRSTEAIPEEQWCQVATTYDGSSQAAGLKLYLNGRQLPTEIVRDELKKQCNVKNSSGGDLVIGQRFRDHGFAGGLIDDFRFYTRELTFAELTSLATGKLQTLDFATYISAYDDACRAAFDNLTQSRRNFVMAEEAIHELPIMRELETPRPAYVLARGQYDAAKDATTLVSRNVPLAKILPLPTFEQTPSRLTLARWVTDPRHPLTARVAVNRLWANFFSAGLVGTSENFGLQGDLPTHPELLDWLARNFIDSGWDVKQLCKKISLSATYRQDSRVDAAQLAADPQNMLLARGPAYRLNAEQIRDLALSASGLAINEVGGPPVSPYQPGKDLWREANTMSPPYQQSVGQSLYRRSLYSVWKRTAPLPNMLAFDSPTREVCTVKRSRTNTPLQALVLLNDVQFIEAARAMATEVVNADVNISSEQKIVDAFRRWTTRRPTQSELSVLSKLYKAELEYFVSNPEQASSLISLGDFHSAVETSKAELAAMTVICQSILNLDATIWKR